MGIPSSDRCGNRDRIINGDGVRELRILPGIHLTLYRHSILFSSIFEPDLFYSHRDSNLIFSYILRSPLTTKNQFEMVFFFFFLQVKEALF